MPSIFLCLFIRKIKSTNGKTYIQVVDKSSGGYRVLKSFGGSSNKGELLKLVDAAQQWISKYTGAQEFDFTNSDAVVEQMFLKLEGTITVALNQEKLQQDVRWDGLKGYITNSQLSKEQIIENYGHLWQIEKAFRIAKTDTLKLPKIFLLPPHIIATEFCLLRKRRKLLQTRL